MNIQFILSDFKTLGSNMKIGVIFLTRFKFYNSLIFSLHILLFQLVVFLYGNPTVIPCTFKFVF